LSVLAGGNNSTSRFDSMQGLQRLTFEVFGRRVIVEATPDGWAAFYRDNDGNRRPADFVIPPELGSDGIAGYLDDLFHEWASEDHPSVRVLWPSPVGVSR
jgi:hypothetical protein